MGGEFLVPALALTTMGLAIGIAVWSIYRTKKKPDSKKSSLAKDGPGPQPFR